MSDSQTPLARSDVEINEVPDGLVIYDALGDRVHYLNQSAAVVFALCDGTNDESAIAAQLAEIFVTEKSPVEETHDCIEVLRKQGLLA